MLLLYLDLGKISYFDVLHPCWYTCHRKAKGSEAADKRETTNKQGRRCTTPRDIVRKHAFPNYRTNHMQCPLPNF
jgi:hypothetical protein